jgi:apolipoprotein N-acyltransferase
MESIPLAPDASLHPHDPVPPRPWPLLHPQAKAAHLARRPDAGVEGNVNARRKGGVKIAVLLAVLSGILQILAFPRFNLPWLAAVAVTPLLLALAREPQPRSQFLLGWLAGAIFWGGTCYWVYGVMHEYADLTAPAAAAIFAGFFLVKGLHLGFFAVLSAPLLRRFWAVPAVAACWVTVEGTHQYLGFTWLHLGNAGASMSVLAPLAPFTGVYGLSFAFAMMGTGLALVLLRLPRKNLLWLAALPLLYLLPALPNPRTGGHTARLVQPNVHPDLLKQGGWTAAAATEHMRRMSALSTREAQVFGGKPPELLIWPEYPVPAYFFDSENSRIFMEQVAQQSGAHFIFNTVAYEDPQRRHPLNGAVTLAPAGELVSRYAKIFLVPFGEFVPWPFSLFIEKITLEVGDFVPGREVAIASIGERRIGTFICYESVFAAGVREFVIRGAEALVNISNDSWYGPTAARYQHLLIARMRAMENARWLLRATNDGITSIINPAGRMVAVLPAYRQAVLDGRFDYSTRLTWFTRFGQWFWYASIAATAAFLALCRLGSAPAAGIRAESET